VPLIPAPVNPLPGYWTIFGHSYFQYASGTRNQMGRADSLLRNVLDIEFNNFCNHAQAGSMLTKDQNWSGGWSRVYQNVTGSSSRPTQTPVDSAPYVSNRGAYLLGWGINDVGYNGNTALNNTAYQHAMRAIISRCRCSAFRDNDYTAGTAGTGLIAYGAGFAPTGFTWDQSSGNSYHTATVTTSATITITLPSDYAGEVVALSFIADGTTGTGAGGTVTFTGTAGVTGTLAITQILPVWANWRYPVIKRITNLTSANAGQTIIITASSFGTSGNINFDGYWLEALDAPPVIVCNTAQLTAAGYAIYSAALTATGLSGTTVAATPATITVNTTKGLATAGTVTMPSSGGTVTITYTGITATTLTGCTAAGGSGTYTSNTVTTPGPTDGDVTTFNAALASVVAEFDGMVQVADIDAAISKDPAALGTDGLHPNELGAAKIVDAILAAVSRLTPTTRWGRTAHLNPPAPQSASVVRPHINGLWYTTDGMPNPKGSGTATPTYGYTAVAGDVFAMPFYVTSPDTKWIQWCVELESSTVATTIFMAIFDDKQYRGYPQYAYLQPANFTVITLTTGAGVKLSPTSPTYGYVNSQVDPGLYWVALKIVTAGTTVFNTVSGPSSFLPTLTTAGANPVSSASDPARGNVAWKLAGQGAGAMPATFTVRGQGFGETLATVAPKVGLLIG
jgi:hypothetical protein